MLIWWLNALAVLLLCIVFTGILIPKILLIAFRKKLFDEPDERKIHRGTVPRLGGIAFEPVILFSIFFLFGMNLISGGSSFGNEIKANAPELFMGICALIILYLVGMADDLIGIKYRAKFVVQIFCGILIVVSGIWIDNLQGLFGIHEIPPVIGYPLTIFVIVFIVNSINLIDGIDGLASGLSAAATIVYGIFFMLVGKYIYALIAFATLGVLIPFFYFNVFGNQEQGHKIFMGDTGSLSIGILLSFLSIALLQTYTADTPYNQFTPIILAFAPLIIPCFDVVRVIIHRFKEHRNLFKPDKNHIHHKLLYLGMSQRAAMPTIVFTSIVLTSANVLLSPYLDVNILLVADILFYTLINIWLTSQIKKRQTQTVKQN